MPMDTSCEIRVRVPPERWAKLIPPVRDVSIAKTIAIRSILSMVLAPRWGVESRCSLGPTVIGRLQPLPCAAAAGTRAAREGRNHGLSAHRENVGRTA